MSQIYIKRSLEPVLKKAAFEFPAVVLTGPRQSGKTTLFQHLFGKSYQYVSSEPPDVRASATEDPCSFLELYPPLVMFDEVQFAHRFSYSGYSGSSFAPDLMSVPHVLLEFKKRPL